MFARVVNIRVPQVQGLLEKIEEIPESVLKILPNNIMHFDTERDGFKLRGFCRGL